MKLTRNAIFSLFPTLFVLFVTSCSPKIKPSTNNSSYPKNAGSPDYGNLEYWAAHPGKADPSDSIPEPLRKDLNMGQDVDVFFVHPTTFTDDKDSSMMNARLDDSTLNAKTDNTSILYQASVFNGSCRIYAPRYRQAHIHTYYITDPERKIAAFELAYQDVRAAFQYYMEHFNQGRPFIIASHSQGTTHSTRLIKELISGTNMRNRLVCAYLLGMPVPKDSYPDIPVCQDSLQTGCFVSWRTFRSGYTDKPFDSLDKRTTVVNPLSWTTTGELAPRVSHGGSVLYNFNKVFPHTSDARIVGNVLWISKPKFPGAVLYTKSNYHEGDINLFYMNIRNDVQRRIHLFWKN